MENVIKNVNLGLIFEYLIKTFEFLNLGKDNQVIFYISKTDTATKR